MTVYRFEEMAWHAPVAPGTDDAEAEEAARQGARRRFLSQGDGGFYAQVVDLPPNFATPAHSHSHAEVFMVLEGSCTLNGEQLGAYDMTVIPAEDVYGFTAGPEGLRFLVVRTGPASYAASKG